MDPLRVLSGRGLLLPFELVVDVRFGGRSRGWVSVSARRIGRFCGSGCLLGHGPALIGAGCGLSRKRPPRGPSGPIPTCYAG